MLMLVVTIIIAAVVSGFAGGLGGGTAKSPQASVNCIVDFTNHRFIFEHQGGDAFALKDVKLILASEDTKTTLTTADIGGNVVAFEEIGATDDLIAPGDKFVLRGSDTGWAEGISFGSFNAVKNTRLKWTIIDKDSDKTIATGDIPLL